MDPGGSDLTAEEQAWFNLPDEVKPIYNCEYLLITATRAAGVAIIRIADKRVMFYACPKGQPHSAELLPDGNVVVASSTDGTADGDMLRLYEVDFEKRFAAAPVATYPLPFGHNAVWDRTNELLWATADNVLNTYTYVQSEGKPALVLQDSYPLPEGQNGAHGSSPSTDSTNCGLRPWGRSTNSTWRRRSSSVSMPARPATSSASRRAPPYATIMLYPTESYWSDKLIDTGAAASTRRTDTRSTRDAGCSRIPSVIREDHPAPQILTRHEIHRKKNWNASPGSHAARRMPVGTAAGV